MPLAPLAPGAPEPDFLISHWKPWVPQGLSRLLGSSQPLPVPRGSASWRPLPRQCLEAVPREGAGPTKPLGSKRALLSFWGAPQNGGKATPKRNGHSGVHPRMAERPPPPKRNGPTEPCCHSGVHPITEQAPPLSFWGAPHNGRKANTRGNDAPPGPEPSLVHSENPETAWDNIQGPPRMLSQAVSVKFGRKWLGKPRDGLG